MPGGQFTNLKEQARSLGLAPRWHEVAQTYADVNEMLGDIVKVTPSSKVVGDLALMMVSQDLSIDDVTHPDKEIAFPDSVVAMMKGELSQTPGGWPKVFQEKVLKGEAPLTERAGASIPAVDLVATKKELEESLLKEISEQELASYNMYPVSYTHLTLPTIYSV